MAKRIVVVALSLAVLDTALGATAASAYLVEPGDTLSGISHRTGVPADRIARDNHLSNPDRIYPGQHLAVGGAGSPAPGPPASGSSTYTVRPGDTLWSISRRTGVPVESLVQANRLADPRRIRPGQRLVLPGPAPAGAGQPAASAPPAVHGAAARRILVAAAHERGLRPNFVLAVSLWESGYNQGMVSKAGAVGLMQVLPSTADWAGPALLGRRVDLADATDNARLGAALLRLYLDEFRDPKLALAAYYQGAAATREHGIFPSSRQYVDGISALGNAIDAST